jgi:hypothetical protein
LGNYVLLLVDSVNALFDTLTEIFSGDFSFIDNTKRLRTLLVLGVFTLGSATGLITLSHVLGYVLKHFRHLTTAVIIGFITGSLGVVWPWKRTVYMTDMYGETILDTNGDRIIMNYQRYWPDFSIVENKLAILMIFLGLTLLIILEWYGKQQRSAL